MQRTVGRTAALAVAALGLVGSGVQVTAGASEIGRAEVVRGVCEGVRDCKVMGRFDVTGNGRPDRVALVNHDRDGFIRKGQVTVRVKTDRGRLVRQRVTVRHWRGPVWFGAAAVDGRRGQEIVLGGDRNKYTTDEPGGGTSFSKAFHVVTYQPGSDLTIARGPGGARMWWATSPDGVRTGSGSALFYYEYGWWRKVVDGRLRIAKRWLSTGGAAGIRSKQTVWVWRHGAWRQRSSGPVSDPLGKNYGGWHVRSLPVW